MGLRVNKSDSSGIPNDIYEGLSELFPGDYVASLVSDQCNEKWQAKLGRPDGTLRTRDLYPEDHDLRRIQQVILELRDAK